MATTPDSRRTARVRSLSSSVEAAVKRQTDLLAEVSDGLASVGEHEKAINTLMSELWKPLDALTEMGLSLKGVADMLGVDQADLRDIMKAKPKETKQKNTSDEATVESTTTEGTWSVTE